MSARTTGGPGEKGRRLYYCADGVLVTAEIREPALFEPARCLFPHYEVPSPSGDVSFIPDVSVELSASGYVVATRDAASVICGSETDALAALEFALTRAIVASFRNYVHLHASGAVIDGQAVLAAGKSGAGKSSLALSWAVAGHPVLGDDVVFLNDERVLPFKRLFKVAPATLSTVGIDPETTPFWNPESGEAWYGPDSHAGWAEAAPVAVMTFVRYDPNASLRLTPVSTAEALNAVVHGMMDTGKRPGESFHTLVRVVKNARVFRVVFPAAVAAAEAICSLTK